MSTVMESPQSMSSKLPAHLHEAIDHYIPVQNGWTTVTRAQEMAVCILETKAKVCVDIGTFAGRAAVAMAFACRELNNGNMTYTIDPWHIEEAIEGDTDEASKHWWKENSDLERMHRETMRWVWEHRLERWLTVIRAPSQYVAQLFPVVDFLNIDGCHTEIASCRDVELFLPRLRPKHYLTFDDSDWESTQKALGMIEKQCDLVSDNGQARTYRKR